jgi:hypothetical protein
MRQQAMPGPQPMPEQTNAPAVAEHPAGLAVLHADQRALLERLAAGQTIAAAAAAEYLSLRTANRRIAAARLALGVATTRDAVSAYLRHRHTRG